MREFSIVINMPYSTIDNIFKRGINKANITNIISICKALNISVDKLTQGELVKQTQSNKSYTKSDEKLVEIYHQLNTDGQKKALGYIEDLVDTGKYSNSTSYKIASRDGTNEIKLTPEQRKTLALTIAESKKYNNRDLI